MSFHWHCPFCHHDTTIVSGSSSRNAHFLYIDNSIGPRALASRFVVCPNPECRKVELKVALCETVKKNNQTIADKELQEWTLLPDSSARVFPDYVPPQIRADYVEASKILNLSPKASATLSRRCLQGIIRDFWKVKPGKLVAEIDAIKDKVDETTWAAITAVRKIGNIGAHMEKDVNEIVDVEPTEAQLLIQLIETVITEWYVARHDRQKRMNDLIAVAEEKKA